MWNKNGFRLYIRPNSIYRDPSTDALNLTVTFSHEFFMPIIDNYGGIISSVNQNGSDISFTMISANSSADCGFIDFSLPEQVTGFNDPKDAYLGYDVMVLDNLTNITNTNPGDFDMWRQDHWQLYRHLPSGFEIASLAENVDGIVSDKYLFFHGDITCSAPKKMSSSDLIKMYFDDNGSVELRRGIITQTTLRIKGFNLTTCSTSDIWNGFELQGNNPPSTNSTTLILEDNLVENFNTGIKSWSGSDIELTNNTFTNGKLAVNIHGQANTSFKGNTFIKLDKGVEIFGASNVSINGTPSQPNTFVDCRKNGISAYLSNNVEITNNIFNNCGRVGPLFRDDGGVYAYKSQTLIANNDFMKSPHGIVMTNSNGTSIIYNKFNYHYLAGKFNKNNNLLWVQGNEVLSGKNGFKFTNNLAPQVANNYIIHTTNIINEDNYGIRFDFGGNGNSYLNTINSSQATAGTIFNNTNGGYAYENVHTILNQDQTAGIRIDGASGVTLEGNLINASGSPGVQSFGIVSSVGGAGYIQCNDLIDLEEGIIMEDNSITMDLHSNYLNNAAVGIKLDHSMIGTQSHRGNHFFGPFTSGDIDAQEMDDQDIQGTYFEIDQADGAEFWPNVVLLPLGFQLSDLVDDDDGVTQTCSGPIPPTSITTRILSLCQRIQAIKNNTNIDARRKALILQSYYVMIIKYYGEYSEQWPDCIRSFINGLKGTNTEHMSEVEKARDSIFTFTTPTTSSTSFQTAVDEYIQALNTGIDVENKRSAYETELASISAQYDGISTRNDALISQIETILTSFVPTNEYEDAWQVAMNAWFKDYKGEELSSTEQSEIETVASLCPLYYGKAVYAARSLASDFSDLRYDKIEDCTSSFIRSKRTGSDISEILIYPNPTTGTVTLTGLSGASEVVIYDVLGSQVAQYSTESEIHTVDISQLQGGVYTIRVKSEDRNVTKQIIKVQ